MFPQNEILYERGFNVREAYQRSYLTWCENILCDEINSTHKTSKL